MNDRESPRPPIRRTLVVLFGAICAAGFLAGSYSGWVSGPTPTPADAGAPTLDVQPDSLDIGDQWVQPAFLWTLPVTNSSDHPVEVSDILTSCSCASVEPRSFVVEAGETVPLRVTLDLRKQAPASGQLTKAFQTTITAVVANSDARIHWPLIGSTKNWIEVTPAAMAMGRWSERDQPTPQVVKVRVLQPTSELKAESSSAFVDVSVSADERSGGTVDEYELEMSTKATSAGSIDCDLRVDAIAADGTPFPTFIIPVSGQVVRDVQPIRNSESLGVLTAGKPFQTQIQLASLSDSEFEVLTATCSDDNVQVEAEGGSSTVFHVSGSATGLGMQSTNVHFTVRHADGVTYPVRVPVRYVAAEG